MLDRPLIVAYHTGGPYGSHAEMLRRSLLDACLTGANDFEIDEVAPLGNWRMNAHYRPIYLLGKLLKHRRSGRALLSLDADARVHYDPLGFMSGIATRVDLAFHTHTQPSGRREPLPGTLLVAPTPRAVDTLLAWAKANAEHPTAFDRVNFAEAVAAVRPTVVDLPPEYCFICDTFRQMYPGLIPVIEHMQASRAVRKEEAA